MEPFSQVIRILFFLPLFFSLSWAFALSREEIRARIVAETRNRHPHPPADFWENLGPDALTVVKQMLSENPSSVEKTWLIDGLGHFSDPSVATILEDGIKKDSNPVFKTKMISALIQSQGDIAFDFVEPYLDDQDPHLRLATAKGISRFMSSSRASERLRRFEAGEKEEWVKNSLLAEHKSDPEVRFHRATQQNGLTTEAASGANSAPAETEEGLWQGIVTGGDRPRRAEARLSRNGSGWKVQFALSKKTPVELKASDVEVSMFRLNRLQWLEIRNKKDDTIFLSSRKPKR